MKVIYINFLEFQKSYGIYGSERKYYTTSIVLRTHKWELGTTEN